MDEHGALYFVNPAITSDYFAYLFKLYCRLKESYYYGLKPQKTLPILSRTDSQNIYQEVEEEIMEESIEGENIFNSKLARPAVEQSSFSGQSSVSPSPPYKVTKLEKIECKSVKNQDNTIPSVEAPYQEEDTEKRKVPEAEAVYRDAMQAAILGVEELYAAHEARQISWNKPGLEANQIKMLTSPFSIVQINQYEEVGNSAKLPDVTLLKETPIDVQVTERPEASEPSQSDNNAFKTPAMFRTVKNAPLCSPKGEDIMDADDIYKDRKRNVWTPAENLIFADCMLKHQLNFSLYNIGKRQTKQIVQHWAKIIARLRNQRESGIERPIALDISTMHIISEKIKDYSRVCELARERRYLRFGTIIDQFVLKVDLVDAELLHESTRNFMKMEFRRIKCSHFQDIVLLNYLALYYDAPVSEILEQLLS